MIHVSENMSGHSPIYIKVDLEKANNPPEKVIRFPRLNWARSSAEQQERFTDTLREALAKPEAHQDCLVCEDVDCVQADHLLGIDKFTNKILASS